MPKSMTGYGRGSSAGDNYSVTVELRSVNHRYADFFLRLPRELHSFEDRIRRLLKKGIRRGRVEVSIVTGSSPAGEGAAMLDEGLAAAYCRALGMLADSLDLPMNMGVAELIQLPGVLQERSGAPAEESIWPFLEEALQEALEGLLRGRNEEGGNLARDLTIRLELLDALVEELAALVPGILEEQKLHLEERLTGMLETAFDQGRILMECAVLAERMDIHEEIVRLRSHLKAFEGTLHSEGAIGRRLDFIAQEIFREINTMGAKSQDYRLAALVVEMKTELEKMREQIQNIE